MRTLKCAHFWWSPRRTELDIQFGVRRQKTAGYAEALIRALNVL
jgi:hypothetical protein